MTETVFFLHLGTWRRAVDRGQGGATTVLAGYATMMMMMTGIFVRTAALAWKNHHSGAHGNPIRLCVRESVNRVWVDEVRSDVGIGDVRLAPCVHTRQYVPSPVYIYLAFDVHTMGPLWTRSASRQCSFDQSCPWVHFLWPDPTRPNPILTVIG